jgi:hypothetical protein
MYTSDGETWTLSFVIDAKEGDCFHTLWERVWSFDWVMKKGHGKKNVLRTGLTILFLRHLTMTSGLKTFE